MVNSDNNSRKNRKRLLLLLILLLLSIGLSLLFYFLNKKANINNQNRLNSIALSDSLRVADSINKLDSIRVADSLKIADSLKRAMDSLALINRNNSIANRKTDSLNNLVKRRRDSLALIEKLIADSLALAKLDSSKNADSLKTLDSINNLNIPCSDTTAPWIYPSPSGGLHYGSISITFTTNKDCDIFWKFDGETKFKQYNGKKIPISTSTKLIYYGIDSCKNEFTESSKSYTIKKGAKDNCPSAMVTIENGDNSFCIDQFEWPNIKGKNPTSNVSLSQAADSCFVVGKRLCSASEWQKACEGKYNWKYPYGKTYSQKACVTQGKSRQKSGSAGECRGWYAVYDMVGNLSEWTSTTYSKDTHFNIVKGGLWKSGSSASCQSERYSYYPQNRHNSVGFRCCKSK